MATNADTWNPERVILKYASKRIVKVHEGYLPIVLALTSRGLVRIVSHKTGSGVIRVGPAANSKN
jgi:hypothetical protein